MKKKSKKKKKEKLEIEQEKPQEYTSIYDAFNAVKKADKEQKITDTTLYHELVSESELPSNKNAGIKALNEYHIQN